MKNDREIWMPVNGYGNYSISNFGHIKYSDSDKRIKVEKNNWGYKYIRLRKDKKTFTTTIHRLVALHFVPNPDNKPQVNHINKNKNHNSYFNLEWVTVKENLSYGKKPIRNSKKYYRDYYEKYYKYICKQKYLDRKSADPNFHNSKRGRKSYLETV